MALQTINVGNYVNDGTGDDLRTAFVKVNENFDELDLRSGQNNTASNTGTGAGIYKEKVGVDLRFKSIKAGNGISVVQNTSDITINNDWEAITTIRADDNNTFTSNGSSTLIITGGGAITTSINNNTLTIDGVSNIESESAPRLGADLNLNNHDIVDYNLSLRRINDDVTYFDFGVINSVPSTFFQWLKDQYDFDLGTFDSPAAVDIDLGTIV
jgi:hypothetical protein